MMTDAHSCSAITHVALTKVLSHHAVNRALRPKLLRSGGSFDPDDMKMSESISSGFAIKTRLGLALCGQSTAIGVIGRVDRTDRCFIAIAYRSFGGQQGYRAAFIGREILLLTGQLSGPCEGRSL